MLATSARMADACAALHVGDTGFHTKIAGAATAGCACMTSAHEWPNLEGSLSRPVLPLLDCRPPMLVRVAPEGGRMLQASRTRCTCPRAPLLVLEARRRNVGSRRYSDDGDDGNLVALASAWGMGHRSGLTSFRGENRAGFRGLEHTCPLSRLRGDAPDASWLPSAARTGGGRSESCRCVKTVLLRRREKHGESGLRVSPYLLSMSHTGHCSTDRSRLSALNEFLRSGQRKNFSSRTRFTCPRDPLLVSRSRGRHVGSRSYCDDGEWGDLVELVLACGMAIPLHWMHVTLNARHIECTSHWVHVTLNVRHVDCMSRSIYVILHVRYIECTSHKMHVIDARHIGCTSNWMYVTFHVHHIECTSHWMYVTLNVRFIECTSHKVYITLKCTSHKMHVTLDACARLFEEILTFSVDEGGRRSEPTRLISSRLMSNCLVLNRLVLITLNVSQIECTSNRMYVTLNVCHIECISHWVHVTLNARHIECTSHWMYVIFNVRHIKCTSYWMHVTFNVRHIEHTSHRMHDTMMHVALNARHM